MTAAGFDVAGMRLRNQRLTGAPFRSVSDAVRALCAVQAQDYPAASWGIGQRVRDGSASGVQRAYDDGAILRTHVLRPTWHFVMPEDIRWMLALTAPRVKRAMSYYDRQLELDEAAFRKSNRVIEKALAKGGHLTRGELGQGLTAAGLGGTGQRIGHLLMRAELDAIVCSGAMRGKQHTYALLDERARDARAIAGTAARGRDEALAELSLRYFGGHGPALAQDFAWWSGLTVADAKRGIEMNARSLRSEAIDGKTYWYAASSSARSVRGPRARATDHGVRVHLLPNYDEYLIAYKDHDASFVGAAPAGSAALYDMLARHIIVLNGYVAGGWRPVPEKDGVRLETKLIAPLSREQREALVGEAERYARFIGRRVRVTDAAET